MIKLDNVEWPCKTIKGSMIAHEGDGLVTQRPNLARGTVQKQLAPTICCCMGGGVGTVENKDEKLRIRYLTPKECFRLMGFSDEQFNKIRSVVPAKTNQYKLAGNTIVISVLEQIFKSIYIDESFDKARPQQTNLDVCFSNEKVGGDVEKNKS